MLFPPGVRLSVVKYSQSCIQSVQTCVLISAFIKVDICASFKVVISSVILHLKGSCNNTMTGKRWTNIRQQWQTDNPKTFCLQLQLSSAPHLCWMLHLQNSVIGLVLLTLHVRRTSSQQPKPKYTTCLQQTDFWLRLISFLWLRVMVQHQTRSKSCELKRGFKKC